MAGQGGDHRQDVPAADLGIFKNLPEIPHPWNNDYEPSFNPFHMDPELSQLMDFWCNCRYLCCRLGLYLM